MDLKDAKLDTIKGFQLLERRKRAFRLHQLGQTLETIGVCPMESMRRP